ncbi:UDP-N-acetylglucosamine 2-epimerase (non-hydrolyzing) VpsA [soil metagenome]
MHKRPRVLLLFGTRPEAIKMAPVVSALRQDARIRTVVGVTGQHRQMLDSVLATFGIVPDFDLNVMVPGQTLAGLTSRTLTQLDEILAVDPPSLILVQGDTTTAFASTLAAFYRRIPVGHVEAGLRTGNLQSPWPEEANRVLISRLATLHFAPTEQARGHLFSEGVPAANIHVTGNTIVDALQQTVALNETDPPVIAGLPADDRRIVLITGHRRENFGDSFETICKAIAELAHRFAEVNFVYPVHLNPQVREPVMRILHPANLSNVILLDPLPYREFIALFCRSTVVLSDSGGVQEEAPSLGKPVLLMRETTERPEAVAAGAVKLVGANFDRIVSETSKLLADTAAYAAMSRVSNPYGDGHAAERIAAACAAFVARESV